MKLDLTRIRLGSVWLVVPIYLLLARPTAGLLVAGLVLALAGGLIRGWAAGTIRKNRVLTTYGPYAFTRNPLYLGSFLIGLGFAVASGRISFLVFFLGFFLLVYGRTMRKEEARLERLFGADYRRYAEEVPRFLPRLAPLEAVRGRGTETVAGLEAEDFGGVAVAAPPVVRVPVKPPFELRRYFAHREYQALLGLAVMFLALAAKLAF
jgi:hypothetical protein